MRHPRYRPAELGDLGLRHEVHVFLYRFQRQIPEYLLLSTAPHAQSHWRPAVGPVGWEEDLQQAALRVAHRDTGLSQPYDLIAPPTGLHEEVGDLQLVQWPIGMQVPHPQMTPRLSQNVHAAEWCPFEQALKALDAPLQRQNLLQLHLLLAA